MSAGAGTGPDVRQRTATNPHDSAEQLSREIVELIEREGIAPGSMTILSPYDYADSSVVLVKRDMASRIQRLDEYSMRTTPGNKVGFARIDEFKGLENQAIIVIDLPASHDTGRHSTEHYVAMTRARSVLSLIQTDYSEIANRPACKFSNIRDVE